MSSLPAELLNRDLPPQFQNYYVRRLNPICHLLYAPQEAFFYAILAGRQEEFYGPYNSEEEAENFSNEYCDFLIYSYGVVGNNLGAEAEGRALRILLQDNYAARIATDEEEKIGYDIIVCVDIRPYAIQIKSSSEGRRRHRKKYPNIPCFVVSYKKTDQEISNEFKRFFR